MGSLPRGLALLAHGQLVMAASAACYVESAALLVTGRGASPAWLVAAFLGTLGLYLLDSVRSSEREDAISQPNRASLFQGNRGIANLIAIGSLIGAFIATCIARPGFETWVLLLLLGGLAITCLIPVIPTRRGLVTLKHVGFFKPLVISVAWLLGAILIAMQQEIDDTDWSQWTRVVGFSLATLPLLLLDSIWLDRRDMHADNAYKHPTLAGSLSPGGFRFLCVVFLLVSLIGIPFIGAVMLAPFLVGAFLLVVIEPSRLASEPARVWLAACWRFTGLLGLVILPG